jgi:hypothetical protein
MNVTVIGKKNATISAPPITEKIPLKTAICPPVQKLPVKINNLEILRKNLIPIKTNDQIVNKKII